MSDNAAKTARQGLGRAIEVRRVHLGFKRKDLAERARLSYPYISELENGGKEPSAKALRQIADALEMGVAELIANGEHYQDADEDRADQRISTQAVDAASMFSSRLQAHPLSGAAPESSAPLEPPQPPENELRRIVRSVVREEVERLVADELPGIVARELRRVLDDTSGTN